VREERALYDAGVLRLVQQQLTPQYSARSSPQALASGHVHHGVPPSPPLLWMLLGVTCKKKQAETCKASRRGGGREPKQPPGDEQRTLFSSCPLAGDFVFGSARPKIGPGACRWPS